MTSQKIDGLAWLKHRAPVESEKPWAPIESSLPDVTLSSVTVQPDITMDITVTIDASESSVDLEDTNEQLVSNLEDRGFDATSESNTGT